MGARWAIWAFTYAFATRSYVELLCEREPGRVLEYVRQAQMYRLDAWLAICERHGVVDAAAWLHGERGDVVQGLALVCPLVRTERDVARARSLLDLATVFCRRLGSDPEPWALLVHAVMARTGDNTTRTELMRVVAAAMVGVVHSFERVTGSLVEADVDAREAVGALLRELRLHRDVLAMADTIVTRDKHHATARCTVRFLRGLTPHTEVCGACHEDTRSPSAVLLFPCAHVFHQRHVCVRVCVHTAYLALTRHPLPCRCVESGASSCPRCNLAVALSAASR